MKKEFTLRRFNMHSVFTQFHGIAGDPDDSFYQISRTVFRSCLETEYILFRVKKRTIGSTAFCRTVEGRLSEGMYTAMSPRSGGGRQKSAFLKRDSTDRREME